MAISMTDAAARLCTLIDWSRPELADSPAHQSHRAGQSLAAASRFVEHLRRRRTPTHGVSADYLRALAARVTPEQSTVASKTIKAAIDAPHPAPRRGTPILDLSAETLCLGADAATYERMNERFLALHEQWGKSGWGTATILVRWLRAALPQEACPSETLIAPLIWLEAEVEREWSWWRHADESVLGCEGHNIWVTNYGGFWAAGLLFPEIGSLARFAPLAPTWIERETLLVLQPDGFTRERSGYHWGTVGELNELVHLATLNGIRLDPAVHDRLRAAEEVNWKLIASDGDLPMIGDTASHSRPGCLIDALRPGAARYNLPHAKWVAQQLDPDWPVPAQGMPQQDGSNLIDAYNAVRAAPPPTLDTCLPQSGYYAMRSGWTRRDDWTFIDAGSRGTNVTSHDHAAIFHLLLHSRGRAVLIDNSSGPYGENPARQWRKGSMAHNVVTVDGQSQVPARSEWRWGATVTTTVDAWLSRPDWAYFSGVHEGYARLDKPVAAARRKLLYVRSGYWILIDRLTHVLHEDEHTHELHFHLGVPGNLSSDGRYTTQGEGGNLMIIPVPGVVDGTGTMDGGRVEPNPFPMEGYDNPDHLVYRQITTRRGLFVTLLVPFEGAKTPVVSARLLDVEMDRRKVERWEATGLEIEINGQRDVYVDQHMQWNLRWHAGGYTGTARRWHSRLGELV